jgi:exonuclease III
MDYIRKFKTWKVLDWNIHGLNSEAKQLAIRENMEESGCSVICIQETKKESFDNKSIRYFCPKRFDNFAFSPSVGVSGGILVVWNSSVFKETLIQVKRFVVVIEFESAHSDQKRTMVSVYGPCQGDLRDEFIQWLFNLIIRDDELWLVMRDFSFIRLQENINLPGG